MLSILSATKGEIMSCLEEAESVVLTNAGTEVIGAKHHTIMMQTNLRSKLTDFLTHSLDDVRHNRTQAHRRTMVAKIK